MKSPVLTLNELCDEFHISYTTAWRMVKTRRILAYKCGRNWRINREALDHYLADRNRPDRPLTVAESCGLLQIGSLEVYRLIQNGQLQATKEHHEFRIDRESLKRYLSHC